MFRLIAQRAIVIAALLSLFLCLAQPVAAAVGSDPRSPGWWQRTEAWLAHLLAPFGRLFDGSEAAGDYGPELDPNGLRAAPPGGGTRGRYGPELDPDGLAAASGVGAFIDPDGLTGSSAGPGSGGDCGPEVDPDGLAARF